MEYILLIVVVTSLFLTFYRSAAFRRLFGEQGEIGKKLKAQYEFSYRHAFYATGPGRTTLTDIPSENKDISIHPSYKEPSGETHFFGPKNTYGQP